MASSRLDLRNLVRRELQDTATPNLWSDLQINDDLAAAFGWYSEYFPNPLVAIYTSSAGQTSLLVGTAVQRVDAVVIDNATVPPVPDYYTLREPALRSEPSQTFVQPIVPYGLATAHGQAWLYDVQTTSIVFRYALAAGRAVSIYYCALHLLPNDDVTAVTVPDKDSELIVLYACDRLVQSAHTDAVKRGAPGAWADAHQDSGYGARWRSALSDRRRHVASSTLRPLL